MSAKTTAKSLRVSILVITSSVPIRTAFDTNRAKTDPCKPPPEGLHRLMVYPQSPNYV